ncbi:MAG: hypothetical protein Q7T96_01700 [Methylobacter sp.]|nr:hypothetical protein [Methylobacter sp.]
MQFEIHFTRQHYPSLIDISLALAAELQTRAYLFDGIIRMTAIHQSAECLHAIGAMRFALKLSVWRLSYLHGQWPSASLPFIPPALS